MLPDSDLLLQCLRWLHVPTIVTISTQWRSPYKAISPGFSIYDIARLNLAPGSVGIGRSNATAATALLAFITARNPRWIGLPATNLHAPSPPARH